MVVFLFAISFQIKAQLNFQNLDSLPRGLIFHSSCTDGKYLYAINGQYSGNKQQLVSKKIYRYDPSLNKWSTLKDSLSPKIQSIAAYIASTGKIYVIGGGVGGAFIRDYKTPFKGVETIDVKTGKVDTLAVTNPFPAYYSGSAVWNDTIYIFGGTKEGGIPSRSFYAFDRQKK